MESPWVDRREALISGLDQKSNKGLEIAPWFSPIAPKRDGWNTLVLERMDTESFREYTKAHSNPEISSKAHLIEDVDVVWESGTLVNLFNENEISGLDYILSSHTLEHMIDLIDFLQACSNSLCSTGLLCMAIPDMRYTFDVLRNPSTFADVIRVSRLANYCKHESERLLDHIMREVTVGGQGCWSKLDPPKPMWQLSNTIDHAMQAYKDDLSRPDYVDIHSWCFVPASFQLIIHELNCAGFIDFEIRSIIDSQCPGSEFIVQLEKTRSFSFLSAEEKQVRRLDLMFATVRQLAQRVELLPKLENESLPLPVTQSDSSKPSKPHHPLTIRSSMEAIAKRLLRQIRIPLS